MNILPHKSWHVYNKDNVARVRRDEALAKAREDELKQRATEADREHRLQVLRARHRKDQDADATAAGADEPTSSASNMTGLTDAKGHINLFLDLEMAQQKHNKKENPDVVRERKAAEDKWERQYTMYLDQSKKGTVEAKPWYSVPSQPPARQQKSKPKDGPHHEDPMTWVSQAFSADTDSKKPPPPHTQTPAADNGRSERRHRDHKRKRRRRHSDDSESDSAHPRQSTKTAPSSAMDKLRADMLKRQADERARRGLASADTQRPQHPSGKYWSQFNPDLARR